MKKEAKHIKRRQAGINSPTRNEYTRKLESAIRENKKGSYNKCMQ